MIKSICAAALLASVLFTGAAAAQNAATISVENVWARASAGPAGAGAAYFTIRNAGSSADRLVSTSSPVAKHAVLHAHTMKNNVMRMSPIQRLEVAPGKTFTLRPGGHHVMLMGLKKKLVKGESFPITLNFEKAGGITVTVAVQGIAAMGPPGHKSMKMDHGKH